VVKTFFLVLWQLPQYVLGLVLLLFVRPFKDSKEGISYWYHPRFPGGISLGSIIIVRCSPDVRLVKHEHGHSRQSLMFGPLYLLVVGLPSILTAGLGIRWPGGWPEAQADRLGGVDA